MKPALQNPALWPVYGAFFSRADAWSVIKVEIDKIALNHDTSAHTQDGLNIREDYNTAITVPEYVKGGQNKPAAYVKDKSVKIKVRLKVNPPAITSVKIKGTSDDPDGSLGDVAEKTVTFSGGISQSGVADDLATTTMSEAEFIEFTVNGNTPNKVHKSEDAWKWVVTEVGGTAVPDMQVERTFGHKIYTVLAPPITPPWTQAAGDVCNAWTKALELVCDDDWAGGRDTTALAAYYIVDKFFTCGATYHVIGTRRLLVGGNFNLGGLLAASCIDVMNCEDIADAVTCLGNVVGCGNASVKLQRDSGLGFDCKLVMRIGITGWFDYDGLSEHATAKGSDGVFDACYAFENPGSLFPYKLACRITLTEYLSWLIEAGAPQPGIVSTWSPSIQ